MSIRQRLYPDEANTRVLIRHTSDARYIWNLGLEQRNCYRLDRTQKVNYVSQAHELAEARAEFAWLKDGSSVVQQSALRDLDKAFQNWWNNPSHYGRPTWRKAGRNVGFYVRDLKVEKLNRKWGQVLVPKCGWIKFRLTRAFIDIQEASSARVTLNKAGEWYVSFTCLPKPFERKSTSKSIGIDMGIASSVTTSNGEHLDMPVLLTPGEAQRKRRLERQLARQKQGSNHWKDTKESIARLSAKEVNRRKDWIEKNTTELVIDYDLLAGENLDTKNMMKSAKGTLDNPGKNVAQKSGLNRAIQNQAWSTFRKRLEDKAKYATSPVEVVFVNPAYTSLSCSRCGDKTKQNRKSQALFVCVACKYSDNADVNAAKNILAAGLAAIGRGGTSLQKLKTAKHGDPLKRQPPSLVSA